MGKGKKRIEIEPIEDYQSRMVAFTRRRTGLFGKAQKLEEMSGESITIAVISETGQPYIHGSPSLLERALASTSTSTSASSSKSTTGSSSTITAEAAGSSTTTAATGTLEEQFDSFKAWVNSEMEACTSAEKAERLKRKLKRKLSEIERRLDEQSCESDQSSIGN